MATRRDPVYPDAKSKTSFQDGLEFQDFVCTQLALYGIILQNLSSKKYQYEVGENLQGFEIKLDERCTDSGRLSIEVAEKTKDDPERDWTPSGICRNDNSWLYIQGNRQILFVFGKNWLLRYWQEKHPQIVENRPTIRTFFLPFNTAKKGAVRVLIFPCENGKVSADVL
jgi:hypothetical protein